MKVNFMTIFIRGVDIEKPTILLKLLKFLKN